MSEWDEKRVRKEVSWQAYKEGESLFERGRIESLRVNGDLATAGVRVGKRKLRTVVRFGGHLDVDCQCPENRSSGTICPHGVAVALSTFSQESNTTNQGGSAEHASETRLTACRVVFPPGFERGLAAGRLAIRVELDDASPDESDRPLSEWLAKNAGGATYPLLLTLKTAESADLLDAFGGHSRLRTESGDPLSSPADPMPSLKLADSRLKNGRVRLEIDTEGQAFKWGDSLGVLEGSVIGRMPAKSASLHWRDEAVELMNDGALEMPVRDFIQDLDAWLDLLQSPYKGWLGALRFETKAADVSMHVEGSLNALDLKMSVNDAGSAVLSEDGCSVLAPDREAFDQAIHRLTGLGFRPQGATLALRDHDQIVSFLADGIREMEQFGTVKIGSRLDHVRRSLHVIRPHYEFGSRGSLSCELSFQTDGGKVIPRAKVLEILRSGKSSVKTKGGAEVMVSRMIADELEPLLADLGLVRPEGRLELNRAQQECLRSVANPELRQAIPRSVPKQSGVATLRDYQWEGADWILDRWSNFGGALLADEMGLGKTLQTISALAKLKADGELGLTLVLVPTSLLSNWKIEFERFAPELKVVRMHGSKRDALRSEAQNGDVVLTSYGTLVRDLAFHLKQDYQTLVADEASLLRNPDSEVSRTVAKLQPKRRLALTGTPVENRLRDLWSIFRVVSPGYLGSKDEFLERYEQGDPSDAGRLRTRISPFTLRRTKVEVAKDLPARVEIDQWLDLPPDVRTLYREVAQAGLNQWEELDEAGNRGGASMHLLTTLLRLRQICLDPALLGDEIKVGPSAKVEWLDQLLEGKAETSGKILVFSQFAKFLRSYETSKINSSTRVFRLDGSTANRGELVEKFQACREAAVFLISLKAGGYGLNLTAADTVVHMDPWWNPAAEAQASDRAHRIGQTKPVSIYRLLTKNSIEERVMKLQQAKRSLMDQVSQSGSVASLERDDVRDLLSQ